MSDVSKITKGLSELLITDAFMKHNISEESVRRKLSPEQKSQIRSLVGDLQAQVDQFLKGQNSSVPDLPSAPAPEASEASAATLQAAWNDGGDVPRKRKRLTLRRTPPTL